MTCSRWPNLVGFELDDWQRTVIEGSCGVRHDGKWASKRVGINVPRQNGKGGILELVELTALFTWGSDLIIHSAHEFITSQKHSARVWSLVERTPKLLHQVYRQRLVGTHGQEAVKLNDGRMLEFRSRTKAGGRGFSCDFLFLDEAMILPEDALAALLPTLRARPNPQIWYTGSAVDQERDKYGMVFTRLRIDAIERKSDMAYFEWSLPYDHPDEMTEEDYASEDAMWQSNPAFGIRIFREHFDMENDALDRRSSAVELYGVGDYPDPNAHADRPISPEQWAECEDKTSEIVSGLCLAVDVSPERTNRNRGLGTKPVRHLARRSDREAPRNGMGSRPVGRAHRLPCTGTDRGGRARAQVLPSLRSARRSAFPSRNWTAANTPRPAG